MLYTMIVSILPLFYFAIITRYIFLYYARTMDSRLPAISTHPKQPLSVISSTAPSIDDSSINELVTGFTSLHRRCIMEDATIATFLPPLDDNKMRDFWLGLIQQCRSGTPESGEKVIVYLAEDGAISGVASLVLPWSQTGNHRAWVEKLMVDGRLRQRGIARRLMDELERIAVEKGKWILLLDTETGSKAEKVYPKLGYVEYGKIPDYSVSPERLALKSETFFYKNLHVVTPAAK